MPTFMEKPDKVHLGWISAEAEPGRHSIGVIGNEFTDENWKEFEQICSIVPQFRPLRVDFISLKSEAEKLISAPEEYSREISKTSHLMLIGGKHAVTGLAILQSSFTSYLAARSAMLDRALRYLSKNFGKPSQQYDEFVAQTNQEFDSNFAYRLFYNLRNYSQHLGMPISELKISGETNKDGALSLHATIIIGKENIADFLAASNKQPKFRQELASLTDDHFEIVKNTQEDFLSFQRLFIKLFSFHVERIDEMARYRDVVLNLVGKHRQKAISSVPGSSTTGDFTPVLLIGDFDLKKSIVGDELQGKATPRLFGFDELDDLIDIKSECDRNLGRQ